MDVALVGQVGYYRTRYPAAMLEQLVRAVRDGSLPPLDRLGLLDDCFALVQAGHTPTAEVCRMPAPHACRSLQLQNTNAWLLMSIRLRVHLCFGEASTIDVELSVWSRYNNFTCNNVILKTCDPIHNINLKLFKLLSILCTI